MKCYIKSVKSNNVHVSPLFQKTYTICDMCNPRGILLFSMYCFVDLFVLLSSKLCFTMMLPVSFRQIRSECPFDVSRILYGICTNFVLFRVNVRRLLSMYKFKKHVIRLLTTGMYRFISILFRINLQTIRLYLVPDTQNTYHSFFASEIVHYTLISEKRFQATRLLM